jgi:hypothetical protein
LIASAVIRSDCWTCRKISPIEIGSSYEAPEAERALMKACSDAQPALPDIFTVVLADPAASQRLADMMVDPMSMSPEKFAGFLLADAAKWRRPVEESRLAPLRAHQRGLAPPTVEVFPRIGA